MRRERRYPALEIVSVLLKVLAVIVAVIGIITAIAAPFTTTATFVAELGLVISILLVAAFQALVLYAIAELILVVIDIEHNTYLSSEAVQPRPERPKARKAA